MWAVTHRLARLGRGCSDQPQTAGANSISLSTAADWVGGHGGDGQAAAHADPGQGDLGVRVPLADQVDAGADVLDAPGPSAPRRRARASGQSPGRRRRRSRSPARPTSRPPGGRRWNSRSCRAGRRSPTRLTRRHPAHQAQPGAVEADEASVSKRGPRKPSGPSSRPLGRRRAGDSTAAEAEDQGAAVHVPRISATRRRR
jgi:hypothetical protein